MTLDNEEKEEGVEGDKTRLNKRIELDGKESIGYRIKWKRHRTRPTQQSICPSSVIPWPMEEELYARPILAA